jgi:chromate transporter
MKSTIYKLILGSLKIAFLSFGGGNAVVPIIHKEFVEKYGFVSDEEFKQAFILANTLPGPTISQLCAFAAYKVAGVWGVIVCLSVVLIPGPLLLVLSLSIIYNFVAKEDIIKFSLGIMPVIMAMLFVFTYQMIKKDRQVSYNWQIYIAILVVVLVALFMKINVAIIFFVLITLLGLIRVK